MPSALLETGPPVVLGDMLHVTPVATIDVKDFSAYRLASGKALKRVF